MPGSPGSTVAASSASAASGVRSSFNSISSAMHILLQRLALHTVDIVSSRQRSEEHTSELQSLMRISYAVFCLKKKKHIKKQNNRHNLELNIQKKKTYSAYIKHNIIYTYDTQCIYEQ